MSFEAATSGVALVYAVLDAVDRRDPAAASALVSEDAVLISGNNGLVVGRDGVRAAMAEFLGAITSIRHEVHEVFAEAGNPDHLIARMTVHYEVPNGSKFALPCCNTFRVRRGEIVEYQIYLDMTPVVASLAAT